MVSAVLEGDFKQISSFQNKGPFSMDEGKPDSSKKKKRPLSHGPLVA